MSNNQKNPKVDAFLERSENWKSSFEALRAIILDCDDLTEELKWGHPCYVLGKANVVLMHGFNDYCALLFIKGALMKDPAGILVQQTENVQSARQIRFSSADQIAKMGNVLKDYVHAAIELEKSGAKVEFKKTEEFSMPEEFRVRLDGDQLLATAFRALTPGRQRGYLLHFSSAKQAKTREARIDKCVPKILEGKGLDD